MKVKKETLVNDILSICEERSPITNEEKVALTRFIKNRLRPHGEDYVFYTVHEGQRVYLEFSSPWVLDVVAEYVLKFGLAK